MAEDGEANQLERRVEGVLVREDHPRIIIISDHDKETAIPFAAFGKSLIMADDDDNDDADIFMGGSILASIFGSNNETETGHVDKVTSTTRTPRPVHAEEFEPAVEAANNPSSTDNGSGVGDREATETSHDGEWIAQDSNSAIPVGPKSNNEENELRAPETFTPIVYTGANHTGAENHEPAAEAVRSPPSNESLDTDETRCSVQPLPSTTARTPPPIGLQASRQTTERTGIRSPYLPGPRRLF